MDSKHIQPFILYREGGYANFANEGTETMRGIQYTTWVSIFGEDEQK